uniref:glycosyltransferase n=1 Tax=Flavobacterium sp. TaxID=239 RepID=UPI0040473CD4
MKSLAFIITSDFIENKAGGGQVFKSNLKTLEAIYGRVKIYSFNFLKRKVETYNYENGKLNQTKDFLRLSYLRTKYSNLILKTFCYLKLSFKYELFWVEHFYALPSYKTTPNFIFKKIIYSQHDFLFKIKALRNKMPKEKLFVEETTTISKCKSIVAGNQLEVNFCKTTLKKQSYYLPISIDKISVSDFDDSKTIIHLESFNTTASKQGFEYFVDYILPYVQNDIKIKLIGQCTDQYNFENIKGYGFVDCLEDHLKTGTISIIPWKHDTGQRTRVFESLSFGCVIVSYSVLGEIIPELINNVNCILVHSEIEFANVINDIFCDVEKRKRIAKEAVNTARKFSFMKRVTNFKKILEF